MVKTSGSNQTEMLAHQLAYHTEAMESGEMGRLHHFADQRMLKAWWECERSVGKLKGCPLEDDIAK